MCIHYHDESLYWSVPSEKTIYRSHYALGNQREQGNDIGTLEKLWEDLDETSYIDALTCSEHSHGLYWLNKRNETSNISELINGNQWDGSSYPVVIHDGIPSPQSLGIDNDDEKIYYMYNKNLYKYDLEDEDQRGLIRENLGDVKLFFFWEDAFYTGDG